MSSDSPIHTDQCEPQTSSAGFRERLLRAGEYALEPDESGIDGFKLIEQLFPIQSQVYRQAIGELTERLDENGSTADQTAWSMAEARRLLGLTLIPFIEEFFVSDPRSNHGGDLETFRALAQTWAAAQLKSCTAYIVSLAIQDYASHLNHGVIRRSEQDMMRELARLIDEHEQRPEAADLVARARRELRQLSAAVASRPVVDPANPRALSFLLTCTKDGQLRDIALAALILRGNSSPGSEIATNPLQILDVADVASIVGMTRSSVTSNVSKIRSKATKWHQIHKTRYELDPRHLWIYVEPTECGRRETHGPRKDK